MAVVVAVVVAIVIIIVILMLTSVKVEHRLGTSIVYQGVYIPYCFTVPTRQPRPKPSSPGHRAACWPEGVKLSAQIGPIFKTPELREANNLA